MGATEVRLATDGRRHQRAADVIGKDFEARTQTREMGWEGENNGGGDAMEERSDGQME